MAWCGFNLIVPWPGSWAGSALSWRSRLNLRSTPCSILSTWMNGADRFPLVPDSPQVNPQ